MVEPPLSPDDKPTPEQMARVANRLFRQLSREDPRIAERLREIGSFAPRQRRRR